MNNNRHLEKLIKDMSQGNTGSFARFYEATKASVYGFALSILKRPQDAEDIMQETYMNAYRNSGSYRPEGKPLAWLLRITRNLSIDILRSSANRELTLEDMDYHTTEEDFSDASNENMLLISLLMKLPREDRQIMMLHSVAGLKHREIAQLLDIPIATSLSRYHRSKVKLQSFLEEENHD